METANKLILRDLPSLTSLNVGPNGLTVLDTLILRNVGEFDLEKLNLFASVVYVEMIDTKLKDGVLQYFDDVVELDKSP